MKTLKRFLLDIIKILTLLVQQVDEEEIVETPGKTVIQPVKAPAEEPIVEPVDEPEEVIAHPQKKVRIVNSIRVDDKGHYNVSLAPDSQPSTFCIQESVAGNITTNTMGGPPIPAPENFDLLRIKPGKFLPGRILAIALRLYRDANGIWAWERLRNINTYCAGEWLAIERGDEPLPQY